MAESHKFKDLPDLESVFPDVPWRASASGEVWIFNSKEEVDQPVEKGQYVVKIADRYEVHDEEPEKAKPAEPEKEKPSKKSRPDDLPANEVAPENIGAPAGTDEASK